MARPTKQGLDYFPLSVDFFDDDKIVCIEGEFSHKGVLIILRLLCEIYHNGYYAEWNERFRYKLLTRMRGVSADLLNAVVKSLVKWEFFDKDLFDSAQILTSRGIQERYFEATRKRTVKENLPFLLVSAPKTPVSSAKTPVFSAESTQSKVNKSKVIINNNELNFSGNDTHPHPSGNTGRPSGGIAAKLPVTPRCGIIRRPNSKG